ncbi:MAG: metallophosphoesterase family protein [Solirubrobacteraceae bacterium]
MIAIPLIAAAAATATLWAAGDGANGSAPSKAVAAMIARDHPDRFLYLGDVYPVGSAEAFRTAYDPVYGRLAARTAPTPGNHDWGPRADGYLPYWKRKRGHRLAAWYAFDLGGWRILSLNSEAPHGPGSAQLGWLRRELAGEGGTGNCRLAFWHRPRFSAGTVHGDQRDMAPLWGALRGHAALVLNGHEHDLQRFAARDGLVEVVAGAGGNGHYALDSRRRGLAFGDATHYGAARIALQPGSAHVELVARGGKVLDRTDISCD